MVFLVFVFLVTGRWSEYISGYIYIEFTMTLFVNVYCTLRCVVISGVFVWVVGIVCVLLVDWVLFRWRCLLVPVRELCFNVTSYYWFVVREEFFFSLMSMFFVLWRYMKFGSLIVKCSHIFIHLVVYCCSLGVFRWVLLCDSLCFWWIL